MADKQLSTDSYKGVRDFYPEDMAIQRYIFDTWSKTAESFGFERYDASILEPAQLYKAKGAENEEMVNEQTYTFTDRGGREVTLRPEMTPTVARMVAGKRRELSFPLRWYSIPNLFRYERPQRGRLREHWQLNCDIFGGDTLSADIEIISLAHQLLVNFGATPEMFEIRINDRALMERLYGAIGVDTALIPAITRLNDRKRKITANEYRTTLIEIVGDETLAEEIIILLEKSDEQSDIMFALSELGITNVVFDKTLARGFDYYTGTIFEIFDVSGENNRSMLGGGRYDNLTGMFGGEPISGVGFGMGDVTMRDFLETHTLLEGHLEHTHVTIIPMEASNNFEALQLAKKMRAQGVRVSTDYSSKNFGKKIESFHKSRSTGFILLGSNEVASGLYEVKWKFDSDKPLISGDQNKIIEELKRIDSFTSKTQSL
jgi:histidyl-tRNA synthetase